MNRKIAFFFALLSTVVFIPLAAQNGPATQHDKSKNHASAPANDESARGSQVFQQNCSRCHNAPQGFPPQISGTILRHMRVRASLSADDEKALLRFMNP